MIIKSGAKVYYEVMYRTRSSSGGSFSIYQNLGCFEDIRDAVSRLVTFYRQKPECIGDIGIVRTSVKTVGKFKPTQYQD